MFNWNLLQSFQNPLMVLFTKLLAHFSQLPYFFLSSLLIALLLLIMLFCSAWMRYHKHMKRKKALLAKKQEDARIWHQQRVQRIHLKLWIVSFHLVKAKLRVVQYTRSVTGRQTVFDPWRIVTARLFVSVRDRLRNYSWFCYGEGEDVGGSSRSGRIVTIRHSRDGWWRFVKPLVNSLWP